LRLRFGLSEDRFWPEGDFWAVCLWAEETRFLDAGAVIAASSWLLLGPSGLSKEWQFGHSLAELLLAALWAAQFQLRHFGNVLNAKGVRRPVKGAGLGLPSRRTGLGHAW
jgi:hypothetical protein